MNKFRMLVLCFVAAGAFAAEPNGVYSNRASGFDVETLFLAGEGKGFYFIAVGGVPVTWRYNSSDKTIVVRGNLGPNYKIEERVFTYQPETDVVTTKSTTSPRLMQMPKIAKEIPAEIQESLRKVDWNFEKHVLK